MQLAEPIEKSSTAAERLARRNWDANLCSLAAAQPRLPELLSLETPAFEWLFARDGSLTALTAQQTWHSGCSVPRRAAEIMLRGIEPAGVVSCFLAPAHAAQIRAALAKLGGEQALIVIAPDPADAKLLLMCDRFSSEITAGRLWLITGDAWDAELERLFDDQPGLPTPTQFFRPATLDPAAAEQMAATAQKVFAQVQTRRLQAAERIAQQFVPRRSASPRLCIVAPSHFRLWDDTGFALWQMFAAADRDAAEIAWFDPDKPSSAAPSLLAQVASQCDAVLTPNRSRACMPGVLPAALPWITWVTTPLIPSAASAGPRDGLLVADAAWTRLALEAGWTAERIAVVSWPRNRPAGDSSSVPFLAVAADTRPLDPPARLSDFSSHELLWEQIRNDLAADPFAMDDDVAGYFERQMALLDIASNSVDASLFLELLIVPAYQQGLVRTLLAASLPVRLFGKGWQELPEFEPHAHGPIDSRETLLETIELATGLVHVWPLASTHPIEIAGRPVVRRGPGGGTAFVRDAVQILRGTKEIAPELNPPLPLELVLALLPGGQSTARA